MSNAVKPERKGNRPEGHEQFTVADMANENAKFYESKPDADDGLEKAKGAPGVEPKLFPPGSSPEWMYHAEEQRPDTDETTTDGGETAVEPEPEPEPAETQVVENVDPNPTPATPDETAELPERSVADDPLTWMPGDFVDEIDGTPAVNRKGFEVLSHFYDISVHSDLEAAPEAHDFEYCRVKAVATTPDGRECEAYGSAHVERGDDPELLLEMADTRARKRALSIATGVGAVAVAELKNELQ